jgi:hypothetical protein
VIERQAHYIEKAAAQELQTYLMKLGSREIPIVESNGGRPFDDGGIYLGKNKACKDFLYNEQEFDALGYDGFILRMREGNILVAGKNHRGTVYAMYRLLEHLGCRFYAKELEVIPAKPKIVIQGPLDVSDSAAFEWRAMMGTIAPMKCGLSPGEWEASIAGVEVPKMMAIPKAKGAFWHHTMGFLLPAKEISETHPEYIAQIDGKRAVVEPFRQQYCLSNPGLLKLMTEAVLNWIASDPDKLYYPVHYGDVRSFCECNDCKAMYAEKGSVTDAVIWFVNEIARVVAEKYPNKFLTTLAYLTTRPPPKKVKPEANLLIIFCAILECQGRPWSSPINKIVCQDLEKWIKLHPLGPRGIISFDYPTTYNYAGFPFPALYAFVENIRYYHKLGLRGVYVCGLGSWKHLEHLYSYVIPRIMWKPGQDINPLIDDFCQAWYGAAWKPMREYIELLHKSAMESKCDGVMDCHAGPGQKFFRELFTPDFMTKAYDLFKQAELLAHEEPVKTRIAKEKWGLLFVDLFIYGTGLKEPKLDEYKKVSEFLKIHQLFKRPWVINPRKWHYFTLSSFTGFEPETDPWWESKQIKELMENPEAMWKKRLKAT